MAELSTSYETWAKILNTFLDNCNFLRFIMFEHYDIIHDYITEN